MVGCILFFVVSCQAKVEPIPTEAKPYILSLPNLFSQLTARQSEIRDVKAFVRTKITSGYLNQTFNQALCIKGNEAIRVDTYNLFRQIIGVLIHDNGKTLMYDPRENRVIHGEEVWANMHRFMGNIFDIRKYIRVFSGGIPRLSHLQPKVSRWNTDQTVYQVEAVDGGTGERVNIEIDGYTQLPKSLFLLRGTEEIYSIYWDDYRKVSQWDFAHRIVFDLKFKDQVVTVKYSDISINQGLAPDVFKLGSVN